MTFELPSSAVRVRDMPWEEMRKLLRQIAPEITLLAARGDRFANKVMQRYRYAYDHPKDWQANFDLRTAVEDYMDRELRDHERRDLLSRFGHRKPQ